MSTTMSDNTTQDEFNPTHWDDFVWRLGGRTHSLGEYVMKLGDRIHGTPRPMGLDEAHSQGRAGGLSTSLRLLFQSTGRIGGLLTAILREANLTTEELAAKTETSATAGIAVGRVRELQNDAVATPQEVWTIKSALFTALEQEEDRRTAEFYASQERAIAAAKARQAATA